MQYQLNILRGCCNKVTELNAFFEQEEHDWLDDLPYYQKDIVSSLLVSNSYENAAIAWLEASVDNTSPFSAGEKTENEYFKALKNEFHKLLCGNSEYKSEQDELVKLINGPEGKTAIVSTISAMIGANLGLAATFIAPAIVLLLMTVAKISLNAWCTIQIED